MKTNKGTGYRGHTQVYAAPEVLKIDINKNQDLGFNPWKAQVFSLGIFILDMFGFFSSYIHWNEVDSLKISPEKFEDFMNLIQSFKSSQENK